ncbi:HAD family hydrolase [Desulfohalovibrio reitneri]|uniref:HAD family hydrolase n=1 Tax=Desulfohalovibrio reitneri TaxID=1307759 RepID=UPI0004A6BF51|nr:HAD family hydrolase [Desulfohalovibrio reitneri]
MPYTAVLFDFDGTLAETRVDFPLMARKVEALAGAYLDPVPPNGHGRPVLERLDELAGAVEAEHDAETAREFHTRGRFLIMDMELAGARAGRLFPFARGLLADLRGRGVLTGVVTRNCTPAVIELFPDVAREADVFLAREDVARPKPDPAHLRLALERLGVEPGRAVLVGDHALDAQSARAMGMDACGAASGRLSEADLAEAGARFTAADAAACIDLLRGQGLLP